MKPVRFDYERPSDIATALALGAREDIVVKFLAGGQSLGPMLNLRLVQPDLLVDITAIAELKRIEEGADGITIGSCITHADIEDGRVPDVTRGALRAVAAGIAYRAVRNRGTIGGSIVHADPSADWLSALAALGASVIARGLQGDRRIPVETFMLGVFESSLRPGEVVTASEKNNTTAISAMKVRAFISVSSTEPDDVDARAALAEMSVMDVALPRFCGRPARGRVPLPQRSPPRSLRRGRTGQ